MVIDRTPRRMVGGLDLSTTPMLPTMDQQAIFPAPTPLQHEVCERVSEPVGLSVLDVENLLTMQPAFEHLRRRLSGRSIGCMTCSTNRSCGPGACICPFRGRFDRLAPIVPGGLPRREQRDSDALELTRGLRAWAFGLRAVSARAIWPLARRDELA
jgi:hypothetical protein